METLFIILGIITFVFGIWAIKTVNKYFAFIKKAEENEIETRKLIDDYAIFERTLSENSSSRRELANNKRELSRLESYNAIAIASEAFAEAHQLIKRYREQQGPLSQTLAKVRQEAAPILAERKRLQDIRDEEERLARKKRQEQENEARRKREEQEADDRRKRQREQDDADARRRSESYSSNNSSNDSGSSWSGGGGGSGGGGASDNW